MLNIDFNLFRDFLPRGSGIVTRRPLILQLIQDRSGKNLFAALFCYTFSHIELSKFLFS